MNEDRPQATAGKHQLGALRLNQTKLIVLLILVAIGLYINERDARSRPPGTKFDRSGKERPGRILEVALERRKSWQVPQVSEGIRFIR